VLYCYLCASLSEMHVRPAELLKNLLDSECVLLNGVR
jgi:hypothetical protein